MAQTNYYNFGGKLRGEGTVGGSGMRAYGPDALGSVVATYTTAGVLENTYRYKPYGAQLAKTGAATDPRYTWVGSHGYQQTGRTYSDSYMGFRHYSTATARWTSVDPVWPKQPAYAYARNRPNVHIDPSGLGPCEDGRDQCYDDANDTYLNCYYYASRYLEGELEMCRKLPKAVQKACFEKALGTFVRKTANCIDKATRHGALCALQYAECLEGEAAAGAVVGYTIAVGVTSFFEAVGESELVLAL